MKPASKPHLRADGDLLGLRDVRLPSARRRAGGGDGCLLSLPALTSSELSRAPDALFCTPDTCACALPPAASACLALTSTFSGESREGDICLGLSGDGGNVIPRRAD